MWVEPTVKLPCIRRDNRGMYTASVTPYNNTSERTLGNKLCSKVICVCAFECYSGHNIHSNILFVNYPKMSNTQIYSWNNIT